MQRGGRQFLLLFGALGMSGCITVSARLGSNDSKQSDPGRHDQPARAVVERVDKAARAGLAVPHQQLREISPQLARRVVESRGRESLPHERSFGGATGRQESQTQLVAAVTDVAPSAADSDAHGFLTIDGQTYRLQPVSMRPQDHAGEGSEANAPAIVTAAGMLPLADVPPPAPEAEGAGAPPAELSNSQVLELNLPTALSMVGGQHPAVGFAQWRVQEAYARLDQSEALWLPSLRAGVSFHRHDGNYQASDGSIIDVNRNSFQYGLGAGATGAGTTQRPGLVAQFHLADAIFEPDVSRKTAWAEGHAANGVMNEQMLTVAVSYLDLLGAVQERRIVEESRQRTSELTRLTSDFAAAGQGPQADADRLQTELSLIDGRLLEAAERIDVSSARLAEALSVDADQSLRPLDPTVVPLELVSLDVDRGTLISTGLTSRPELKESQALVAAACDQYQRQRMAPFVPSVLLGLSAGGFGGGLGNNLSNVDDRYDFDALMMWEIRNLGMGERAARRGTQARIEQARFQQVRVLDRVAREVTEAHTQVTHRARRIEATRDAIRSAEASFEHNLSRIRDGQGLPIEALQSLRALEDAQRAYLRAVVDYNEAQFRLQWALGWPVFAPETAAS